ncbi:uncharacterized protein LOC6557768 [Drosophila grimshawi]|uniref:uncharacterized protein LOC6557768 n=1 Tax=Drosophila grimshawi TaxID=7222 RepID=UPI000C86E99B|nr:uncharacterized protein LOC6557768 [Drosophila grimshawi]
MPRWLVYGACVLFATALALDESVNNNLNDNEQDPDADLHLPSEVQKAVCTVNAGEVKASAEAVTTKTLKGVCGSDEMNRAFRNLEEKLYGELREIKELLLKLIEMEEQPDSNSIPLTPTLDETPIVKVPLSLKKIKFEQITMKPPSQENNAKKQPKLKQLDITAEREAEIGRFNNTMLADQDFQLFTYYWKLENFTDHISDASTKTINSPKFSIRGKTLQLKCTFQHMHREMINLQLALAYPSHDHASGKENNIMLDMGGQWKQLKWTEHVAFKHKISLLNQNPSHRRTQDLSSQELTKLDMGFSIPNSAIVGSNYVRHNSLLIQIILYL